MLEEEKCPICTEELGDQSSFDRYELYDSSACKIDEFCFHNNADCFDRGVEILMKKARENYFVYVTSVLHDKRYEFRLVVNMVDDSFRVSLRFKEPKWNDSSNIWEYIPDEKNCKFVDQIIEDDLVFVSTKKAWAQSRMMTLGIRKNYDIDSSQYNKAIKIRDELIKAGKNNFEKKLDAVIRYCNKLIQFIDIDSDELGNLSENNLQSNLSKEERNIASLNQAIKMTPNDYDLYVQKGDSLRIMQKYPEAIACYDKAIELNPKSARSHSNKGATLVLLNRHHEAIICFDKAIELQPDIAGLYVNLAFSLSALKLHQESIKFYDKAIELDPNSPKVYYGKAATLSDLGRHQEAVECYDKAIELDPNQWSTHYNKALSLHPIGKIKEAIECLDKAIQLNPNNFNAYLNKGYYLSNLNRHQEAIECFDKAIQINPNEWRFYLLKGNSLRALDKNHEAVECYKKADKLQYK